MLNITPSFSCITCNQQIQEGIWNSAFYPNLFTMLSAFIVLAVVVAILAAVSTKRHQKRVAVSNKALLSPVPLTTASMVLGIGIGGFMDGIVLHQILQWHEMLSNKIPSTEYIGKSVNMFWDGIFHFFCLLVVSIGIVLLWRVARRKDVNTSGKLLGGGLLLGWGLFNIIEGVIDHHLLELHYVMQFSAAPEVANFVFLGASIVMILIGWAIIRTAPAQDPLL